MKSLNIFENPDEIILAIDYNKNNEYHLEIGEEFIYESDEMTEDEIIEWAEDSGYFDQCNDYLDEDGKPMIDSLREKKRSQEEDYLPSRASPSGRAFIFFSKFDIPDKINIDLIDGPNPGSDWQGVIVHGLDHLAYLQDYFFKKDFKVNFIIQ